MDSASWTATKNDANQLVTRDLRRFVLFAYGGWNDAAFVAVLARAGLR